MNPWLLAPLGGPWILEGAERGPPPRILGQVLSWSQAKTGPGSFSRLTNSSHLLLALLSPHLSTVSTTQKEANREAGELGNSRPPAAS